MPVRITCPSCSATLSIKDEHATRAVKCPKCGGVIPPQPAPPATVSDPEALPTVPPEPKRAEPRDEPEPPARTKTGGKITGAPTSSRSRADRDEGEDDRPRKKRDADARAEDDRPKRKPRDEDDEGEGDDRPKRKPRDEDDDDDRPRSTRRRDEDDRDDDRPRRRRRDEDDEDDRPVVTRRKPPPKSNAPVILAVVGFFLLTCCGAGGYGAYWFVNRVKEEAEKLGTQNAAVTRANYDKLVRGATTRAQADEILGGRGRPATSADLNKLFGTDKSTIASWQGAVDKNRVLLWQNGEDYIITMFHPNTDADARVQMKLWRPKAPPGASEGLADDAAFVQKFPLKGEDVSGPAVEAAAEEIATAYKDGRAAADARYKDKIVLVEGVLDRLDVAPDGALYARLTGTGTVAAAGNVQPRCAIQNVPAEVNKVFNLSRGQTVKFRGKCAGLSGPFVDVTSAKVESSGPDPAVPTSAAALLSLYATNEGLADDRFKGKQLTVTSAVVESKTADAVYLVSSSKAAKSSLKIKVAIAGDFRRLYENLKPGDPVRRIKGECTGKSDAEVYLNGAWIAP